MLPFSSVLHLRSMPSHRRPHVFTHKEVLLPPPSCLGNKTPLYKKCFFSTAFFSRDLHFIIHSFCATCVSGRDALLIRKQIQKKGGEKKKVQKITINKRPTYLLLSLKLIFNLLLCSVGSLVNSFTCIFLFSLPNKSS